MAAAPAPLDGLPETSVYYAAPERLRGGRPSVPADVFAFGILLCEVPRPARPRPLLRP